MKEAVIAARPHPEQGFRTCLGILSLAKSYGAERVHAACRRGILIKARSVASIRSILQNGMDRSFLDEPWEHQPLRHGNIRGRDYFHCKRDFPRTLTPAVLMDCPSGSAQ